MSNRDDLLEKLQPLMTLVAGLDLDDPAGAVARLDAELPPGWTARLTGPLAVVHEMVDEIQRTQLSSFGSCVSLIS